MDTRYAHNASGAAAVLFQGKWRVEILCAMRSGPVHMGQLSRLIPGASKKMLTQNLRRLEADGIVVRHDMSEMVLHVEYDFNHEAREEVCSLLDHLAHWGDSTRRAKPFPLKMMDGPRSRLLLVASLCSSQVASREANGGRCRRRNLTPATQPASEGRNPGGQRVQGETSTGSPCRFFAGEN